MIFCLNNIEHDGIPIVGVRFRLLHKFSGLCWIIVAINSSTGQNVSGFFVASLEVLTDPAEQLWNDNPT
jgi:hypothetical protein